MTDLIGGQIAVLFDVLAPAGLPASMTDALSREFQRAVAEADIQEELKELSAAPVGSSPEALTAHMKSELAKWSVVIKSIGLKIE
jgi:tripartite-type tricarboxylate transporter receptor subunit TctC